jgi:prepilin-type N-terminal cleavage/methylation domain-containing protein/prepilin-type processing-associated H-X9-DG protein
MRKRSAFTLVELLVVIGIIAVLISILLPAMSRAWASAKTTACTSNLREIGNAYRMYANDNRDHYPDKFTLGNWGFRRRPGMRNPSDPSSYPEWMGLAAVLHGIRLNDFDFNMPKEQVQQAIDRMLAGKGKYLPATSNVWVCPARPEPFMEYGVTYAFTMNLDMGKWTSINRGKHSKMDNVGLVWDNTNWKPYTPGAMAPNSPGSAYTYTPAYFTHKVKGQRTALNILYMDGHVALQSSK